MAVEESKNPDDFGLENGGKSGVGAQAKLQADLAHAVERLDLATRAAGIGLWDWDIASNTLIWDEQMHRLYGVQCGDFSPDHEAWLRSVHPDDRDAANNDSARALAGIQDYSTEFRVIRPRGEIRHLKALGTVIRDAEGKALRMVGVHYDVTEQRMARKVAHDINNLLGVIMAHAGMAMEDVDPSSPLYESLAEIGLTAQRAAALTHQLMASAGPQP